jgi:hypothetical protein
MLDSVIFDLEDELVNALQSERAQSSDYEDREEG